MKKHHFVSRYGLNGTPTFEEFVKMTDGERTSCPLKGIATPVFGALMSIGHPKHLTVVYRNSDRASNCASNSLIRLIGIRRNRSCNMLIRGNRMAGREEFRSSQQLYCPNAGIVSGDTLSGFEQQQRRMINNDKGATTNEQGTTKFAHHSTQSQSNLTLLCL